MTDHELCQALTARRGCLADSSPPEALIEQLHLIAAVLKLTDDLILGCYVADAAGITDDIAGDCDFQKMAAAITARADDWEERLELANPFAADRSAA